MFSSPITHLVSARRLASSRHLIENLAALQTRNRQLSTVRRLTDWDLVTFQNVAYNSERPAHLPRLRKSMFPASKKWFLYDGNEQVNLAEEVPRTAELNPDFWNPHAQAIVPLELTQYSSTDPSKLTFEKTEAPLGLFLQYIENSKSNVLQNHRIYLAQHDLRDLPKALQDDLPTPELVLHAGKGDLYSSSLWLGRPPTYTPLHRDPNPNLFVQLAGTKVVRLFSPEVGKAVFDFATRSIQAPGSTSQSAIFRGEEMMQGPERAALEQLVWGSEQKDEANLVKGQMLEATLHTSEALFIPKGWWHSVKGIGTGITASANWWFR